MAEGTSSERHPVRVLIRDEEVGDISAHSWMHVATDEDDESEGHGWMIDTPEGGADQVYVMSVHREGQANRGSFLRWFDPNDTEGEGVGGVLLHPAGPDDREGQGFQAGVLRPDPSGSWTVHLDAEQA
jgi:hypothetical protein